MSKFRNAVIGVSLLLATVGCAVEGTSPLPDSGSQTTPYKVSENEINVSTSGTLNLPPETTTTTVNIPQVTTTTKVVPQIPHTPSRTNVNGFLSCVKNRESRGNYGVVNNSSGAGGAYQFLPSTWNNVARHIGRNDLVGIHPSQAAPATQDMMAQALLNWQGKSPWAGPGC